MKVYIVWEDDPEGMSQIHGVFSTQEKAEAYKRKTREQRWKGFEEYFDKIFLIEDFEMDEEWGLDESVFAL